MSDSIGRIRLEFMSNGHVVLKIIGYEKCFDDIDDMVEALRIIQGKMMDDYEACP